MSGSWRVASRLPKQPAFVSLVSRMLFCLAAMATVAVRAGEQSLQLQYDGSALLVLRSPEEPYTLWERFQTAFEQGAGEEFADRFHPLNLMNQRVHFPNTGLESPDDRGAGAARGAFAASSVSGIRDATVGLPFIAWLDDRQEFLADFLRNSIGNADEENIAPLDLSYRVVERSWWGRVSESGQAFYGLRPFRRDPYAYYSYGIKHDDTVLLLCHLRYHYRNFADHRFEFALSLPMPNGFSIDVGTSYQFGRHSEEKRMTCKVLKEFKGGGILHVGFDVQTRPALFAGISFPI